MGLGLELGLGLGLELGWAGPPESKSRDEALLVRLSESVAWEVWPPAVVPQKVVKPPMAQPSELVGVELQAKNQPAGCPEPAESELPELRVRLDPRLD